MNLEQVFSYAALVFILIAAIAQGVSVACNLYMKKMAEEGKKVPVQVVTAKEAADALYTEANQILNITGAQKKEWATEQLQKQKPSLTKEVASGLIQKSYNDAHAEDSKTTSDSETETQPIGFLDNGDDSNGSSQA